MLLLSAAETFSNFSLNSYVEPWGNIMNLGYLLWLLGILIAIVVGFSVLGHTSVPYVTDWLAGIADGSAKALFVALGLVALSKLF